MSKLGKAGKRRCTQCKRVKRLAHFDNRGRTCKACRTCACGQPIHKRGMSCGSEACRAAVRRGAAEQVRRVRAARLARRKRARCSICHLTKPLTLKHYSIYARDAKGAILRWDRTCLECRRAYHKDRYANDPKFRQRMKERSVAQRERERERREQDPEYGRKQRAIKAAHNRAWRERKRRGEAARTPAPLRPVPSRTGALLPAAPLADAIDRLVAMQHPASISEVCVELGINERMYRAWRAGEYKAVQLAVADTILVRTHLNWYDVWDDDEQEAA